MNVLTIHSFRRLSRFLRLGTFILVGPALALAMGNRDVIKMHKAGLSDDTIIAAIQKESKDYDTSASELVDLKEAGVSEAVIRVIINQGSPSEGSAALTTTAGSSAAMPSSPPPPPPTESSPAVTAAGPSTASFQQDFPSIAPPLITPQIGQTYFTRYTFHEEDDTHVTTNYARGPSIPINTQVTLVSEGGSKLVIKRVDTGQSITFKNEEKYTKKSIEEIARLLLSDQKTPLESLPEPVAGAVRVGEMRLGMNKELVLMTRGYPPAHETPSPADNDRWVYWSSRFVKQTIVFTNGRLTDGRGIN